MTHEQLRQRIKEAGGFTYIGKTLGVTPSAVQQWEQVPARHIFKVARILKVRPNQLRPDLF